MMMSSNGNISPLLAFYEGNSPVNGEFPSRKPVTRSFDVFFDLRLNKRLSKQPRRRWLGTPSRSLWCHCNLYEIARHVLNKVRLGTTLSLQFFFKIVHIWLKVCRKMHKAVKQIFNSTALIIFISNIWSLFLFFSSCHASRFFEIFKVIWWVHF